MSCLMSVCLPRALVTQLLMTAMGGTGWPGAVVCVTLTSGEMGAPRWLGLQSSAVKPVLLVALVFFQLGLNFQCFPESLR